MQQPDLSVNLSFSDSDLKKYPQKSKAINPSRIKPKPTGAEKNKPSSLAQLNPAARAEVCDAILAALTKIQEAKKLFSQTLQNLDHSPFIATHQPSGYFLCPYINS